VTDPSRAPEGEFPRWSLWYAPAALFGGLAAAIVLSGVVVGVLRLRSGGPAETDVATLLADVCVVAACLLIASMTTRPRPWHFGLRRAGLGQAAGTAFVGMLVFYAFAVIYTGVVHPSHPQKVVQDVGADKGTAALIAGAVLIIGVAPVAEELFFRGFLFRILRLRMGLVAAAVVDGVVFGAVHYEDPGTAALLPVLAFLGFLFCLVYEQTGTLFATIAMHAFNNMVSYAATADHGVAPSLAVGAIVIAGCAAVPRLLLPARASAPAAG
jgi:membrane protease YdiL (CAAX protease family)